MGAQGLQRERQASPNLLHQRRGEADPTRQGEPFEAGGDVHTVTVNPFSLHHHVSEVKADTKLHATGGLVPLILLPEIGLNGDGPSYRVNSALELGEHVEAVAKPAPPHRFR